VTGVLESFSPELSALSSIPVNHADFNAYRMRPGIPAARYTPSDLFHIPFDCRYLVANQRYSFPGLPCLYLGSSLYVCWEELGRPDLNSVAISRFHLRAGENIRVLDLSWRPKDLDDLAVPRRLREAVAVLWPVVASCSIAVQPPNATFRAEYIVPQAVLRWIMVKPDFDGLRYFSTHVADPESSRVAVNFVFPSRTTTTAKGACPMLAQKFLLTEPINWQYASLLPQADLSMPHVNADVAFGGVPGGPLSYRMTEFWKMEARLEMFPLVSLI
jgi:hypothetical protein